MQHRAFGRTDLRVSEIGLGCARIGGVFQGTRKEQLELVRTAVDAGITFYDTADMYAQGESERLLGAALRKDRHNVVIATKVGYNFPQSNSLMSRLKPMVRPLVAAVGLKRELMPRRVLTTVDAQDFSPAYIARMLESSLTRLQTDYVDVYQLHSPPPEILDRGDFVETLDALKQQGKIRHWGVACEHAQDALVALKYSSVSAVQLNLSLLHREALDSAIPRAAQRGLGIIARQVFASGLLARPPSEGLSDPRKEHIADLARTADAQRTTLPGMALSFVLAQPGVSVALIGMHQPRHLQAALGYLSG